MDLRRLYQLFVCFFFYIPFFFMNQLQTLADIALTESIAESDDCEFYLNLILKEQCRTRNHYSYNVHLIEIIYLI